MVGIGIIGCIFANNEMVPFWYFFLPMILGVFYMLPCIPLQIKEDLSVKWIVVQRIVELLIIEIGTLWVLKLVLGSIMTRPIMIAIIFSTLILDVLTYVISDALERKEAKMLTAKLQKMQKED